MHIFIHDFMLLSGESLSAKDWNCSITTIMSTLIHTSLRLAAIVIMMIMIAVEGVGGGGHDLSLPQTESSAF